jgi:hypothetical protein
VTQLAETLDTLSSGWSGWLFNFGKSAAAPYSAWTGLRVLLACLVLEGLVRPFVREEVRVLGHGSGTRTLVIASCMLVFAVGLTAVWIRLPLSRVGLYGWRRWTDSEKWFLPQIVAVSLLAFTPTDWNQLAVLPTHAAWIRATVLVFAGQMLWGFYQEYVYRGLLQTELVRRWEQLRASLRVTCSSPSARCTPTTFRTPSSTRADCSSSQRFSRSGCISVRFSIGRGTFGSSR